VKIEPLGLQDINGLKTERWKLKFVATTETNNDLTLTFFPTTFEHFPVFDSIQKKQAKQTFAGAGFIMLNPSGTAGIAWGSPTCKQHIGRDCPKENPEGVLAQIQQGLQKWLQNLPE
jgi:hypothetical protein